MFDEATFRAAWSARTAASRQARIEECKAQIAAAEERSHNARHGSREWHDAGRDLREWTEELNAL